MNKVFALVDCNSFYVSCERVFNPAIKNKPVVVLSNNDGCAISRSNEAKAIGIAMGAPIFKCKELVQKHGVEIFSANFVLYGDMSNRVMAVLRQFTPNLEVYSIDEAFLSLDGFESRGLEDYGRKMRADVYRQTGLPVSIGVAPTKTLAKVANHYAKDHPETAGVFCLMTEDEINHYLAKTPVKEVWGIGREKAIFLERNGIKNALELKNAPDEWIKKHLTIVTLRTVWELRGIPCLSLEEISPNKKAIATTRTFGYEVSGIDEMQEAVAAYVSRSAEKLRRQKSLAGYIQVYVETNPFKDTPYYRNSAGIEVSPATAYTPTLIEAANKLLKRIYRDGLRYKSCGVFLMNLCPESGEQEDLFDEPYQGSPRKRLMEIMDRHNRGSNSGKLFLAAEGLGKPWFMKQAHKSKRFTTRWDELLEVKV
jgi:DNA polymerase V